MNYKFVTHNSSSINCQATTDLQFFVYSLFGVVSYDYSNEKTTFNKYTNNNKDPIQQMTICCHLNSADEYVLCILLNVNMRRVSITVTTG